MKAGSIDFLLDIKSEVIKYLPHDKLDICLTTELQGLASPTLLIRLLNWRERLVHPHARTVFLSKEFSTNLIYVHRRKAFEMLFDDIILGNYINPRLSKQVLFGYLPRDPGKPFKHNPSLDLLLNDLGVHHLHISSKVGADGFTERGDEILIVIFREAAAYVIDIVQHGDWSDQKLVEIAHRNWPE